MLLRRLQFGASVFVLDCVDDLGSRQHAHDPGVVRQGDRQPEGLVVVRTDHDKGIQVGRFVVVGDGEASALQRGALVLVKLHGVVSFPSKPLLAVLSGLNAEALLISGKIGRAAARAAWRNVPHGEQLKHYSPRLNLDLLFSSLLSLSLDRTRTA